MVIRIEHDYDVYLERNPVFATYISNLFITNTMFLIGYSLDDMDLRGIWQIINNRLGGMTQPAYCVVVGASKSQIARYTRRNIHVINLPGKTKDYKKILHDFFVELNDYVSMEKEKTAKSKDDRINEQLLIPPDNNKLCFISCSAKRTAQLSSLLYPILRNRGVTPVRLDDMLMPGDNWLDVVKTIIRKSKVAIVDISDESQFVLAELTMLQSEKKDVLILCESGVELSMHLFRNKVIHYSFELSDKEYALFEQRLTKWIDSSFEVKNENNTNAHYFFNAAKNLFDKGEYSACIVSAYSEFMFLRRISFPYVGTITDRINMEKTNSPILFDKLLKAKALRNKIVNESYVATRNEALAVLDDLSAIINNNSIA